MTTDDSLADLATIENTLRRFDRHILERSLRPGITAATVRDALGGVGLAAPPELISLYGWRDGTSTSGVEAVDDIHLFPGFYLLSVEDAVANFRAFVADSRWQTGWLPLFANGGGDFYVLDLGGPAARPVRHFRIDEAEHPIEFNSLESMFRTLAEAFERNVFFVDTDGYLETDDVVFGELAAELNPDVAWWRD